MCLVPVGTHSRNQVIAVLQQMTETAGAGDCCRTGHQVLHQRAWFWLLYSQDNVVYSFKDSLWHSQNTPLYLSGTIQSVTELLRAGYTVVQLRAADVPVSGLHAAGVAAIAASRRLSEKASGE